MTEIDAIRLNFSPESLVALNFILAFVMFGVALFFMALMAGPTNPFRTIDAAVGFASALTGTVIGGLSGLGVGMYELTRRYGSASNIAEQAMSVLRLAPL